MKKLLFTLSFVAILSPFATWAMYKPVRVLAPSLVDNVSCMDSNICVDDKSKYHQAISLYESALRDVSKAVGLFKSQPTVVFCSKDLCFRSFGFNKASATTVGMSGIVVSPRGWKPHLIRHEMIHHRQAEELGIVSMLFEPEWLIEGMAYSLSNDPRTHLSERWEQARVKFDSWFGKMSREDLWEEARKL